MATQQGPIFPTREPIAALTKNAIGEPELWVTEKWRRWLLGLRESIDLAPIAVPVPPVEGANAALSTTSMDGGGLTAGLFAISWYMNVVVAAGVSSSAQVTIAWVDDSGNPKSYTAAAMTGNTTSTVQVNERLTIYAAAGTPITYAVAYASNPSGVMVYNFRPVLQSVATS